MDRPAANTSSPLAINARGDLLYASITGSGEFAVLGIGRDAALTPLTVQHTGQPQDGINTLTAYPRLDSQTGLRNSAADCRRYASGRCSAGGRSGVGC